MFHTTDFCVCYMHHLLRPPHAPHLRFHSTIYFALTITQPFYARPLNALLPSVCCKALLLWLYCDGYRHAHSPTTSTFSHVLHICFVFLPPPCMSFPCMPHITLYSLLSSRSEPHPFPLVCATLDSIACTATTGKDFLAYCYMCMQHYHCLVLREILDPNCFAVEHPQLKLHPRSCSLALRSTSSEEEDRQALGPPFFRPILFIHGYFAF